MAFICYSGSYTSNLIKKRDLFGVWSTLPALPANDNWSLSGTAEDDLWSGSEGTGPPRVYHFNGTLWTAQTLPGAVSGTGTQCNVAAWDENTVFAWAGVPTAGFFRLWRTVDGGSVWSTIDSGSLNLNSDRPNNGLVVGPDEIYLGGGSFTGYCGVWRWKLGVGMQREGTGSGLPSLNNPPYYWHHYVGFGWTGEDPDDLWVCDQGYNAAGYGIRLYRGKFGSWSLQHRFDPTGGYSQTYYGHQDAPSIMSVDENGIVTITCTRQSDSQGGYLHGDPTAGQLTFTPVGAAPYGECAAAGGIYFVPNSNGLLFDNFGWSETPPTTPFNGNLGGALLLSIDTDPPVLSNEDPASGEKNVSKTKPIEFDLTDALSGLDDALTVLQVNNIPVWQGNMALNDWTITKTAITNGWHFELVSPVPFTTPVVTVGVYAEDQEGNVLDTEYPFYPSIDLDLEITVLAQRRIRVEFTHSIALTRQAVNPASYTVLVVDTGAEEVEVQHVLYEIDAPALDYVDLFLSRPIMHRQYQLIASNFQLAATGSATDSTTGEFIAHDTKVDSITKNLGRLYDKSVTSNIHQILTAMGISDEEIGGDTVQAVAAEAIAEEEEELEEEEMPPSPRVTYASVSSVSVDLPLAALGNALSYKLQDGNLYSFAGGETCDLSATGINGLDTGVESISTWYHLYLVPSGIYGTLKPIFSASDPSTGPTGFSVFLPIMAVFNNSAGDIRPFHPVTSPWCYFTEETQTFDLELLLYGSATAIKNAWVDLSTPLAVAAPVAVSDKVELAAWGDSNSGSYFQMYVDTNASPSWTPDSTPNDERAGALDTWSNEDGQVSRRRIPIPTGELAYYCDETAGTGAFQLWVKIIAFQHSYRV